VLVIGQVYNSNALTYTPGRNAGWYLSRAGGPTELASKGGIFIIRSDGSVTGGKEGGFWSGSVLSSSWVPANTIVVSGEAGFLEAAVLKNVLSVCANRVVCGIGCCCRHSMRIHEQEAFDGDYRNNAFCSALGKVSVSYAQGQGTEPAASETPPAKNNPSSKTDVSPEANAVRETSLGTQTGLVGRFIGDQREIWTSPCKASVLRYRVACSAQRCHGRAFRDGPAISASTCRRIPRRSVTTNTVERVCSSTVGGAGGMWVMGHVNHNRHWSETGFLAGEAALNSLVAVESLKYTLRRERPYQGDGSGAVFSEWRHFVSV